MALHWALLAVAAAQDWGELYGRRTQSLPEGMELNETLNGSIPLTIVPSWDVFLSFSDRSKWIKGKLSLTTIFTEEAQTFVEKPEEMVDVLNFASGSGDIDKMSSLKLWDPKSGKQAISVSKIYVGEFSQSLYPYDLSCYPFDTKSVHFRIVLQKPCGLFYRIQLGCPGGKSTLDKDGAVKSCSWPINASSVGFDWDHFTCHLQSNVTMECEMTGVRHWGALLKTYMWPSVVYGLMGFLAFALGVRLAMPRVATTMLALLSLTSLRNQVIALLPISDEASWMEEYFLIAISFMFLNLVGHAASFHLDALGRHHTQKMVNKFNLYGMFTLFLLIVIARLHVRDCNIIDPMISLTMTFVAALVCMSIIFFLVWYHREAFREATRRVTEDFKHAFDDNI